MSSMTLIDKTGEPINTKFKDLDIGEAYIDEDGDTNIKTDICSSIYHTRDYWTPRSVDPEEIVIPLKATITVERKEER